ncbi:MAG: site-2 protease family protein [Saprospiraceae bacterium]|nr:site-2 protease family protein [Saprospiraceae bacterium]
MKNIKSPTGPSLQIGTFWQIPVKIHWSFGILLLFVIFTALTNGYKMWQSIGFILYFLLLFVCVVLHEYGHALTARKFGVVTRDILLSPIGGVARLESIPEKPLHEFYIALAGPFVNVVIALIIGVVLAISTGQIFPDLNNLRFDIPAEFARYILFMNLALFMFNLIPAFPMDGGRVLRSLLAVKLGKNKATFIAMRIGRIIAIGFIVFGILYSQLILSLIGLFIYMMAGQEYDQTKVISILAGTKVRDIMRTSFTQLHLGDPMSSLIEKYYREGEQNFLVFDSLGNLSGTIPEMAFKQISGNNTNEHLTAQHLMSPAIVVVSPEDNLKDVTNQMKEKGSTIAAVVENGHIVGVIDKNNIENHIRLKSD